MGADLNICSLDPASAECCNDNGCGLFFGLNGLLGCLSSVMSKLWPDGNDKEEAFTCCSLLN